MKKIVCFLSMCIMLISCEKAYYGLNSPLVNTSHGVWKLEKIVSPSKTILAKDLGYEKLIQIKPDGSRHNFYSFIDKKQEDTYSFSGITNEVDKKERVYFEVSMGIKLVKFELIPTKDSNGSFSLIMSDFLDKTSQIDSVRYHYSYFSPSKNW
jgi:predicted CopG family antitoxin